MTISSFQETLRTHLRQPAPVRPEVLLSVCLGAWTLIMLLGLLLAF